ncbi:hypothetical protein [Acidithiobacillus acidisediminis]|uniref:hypothetical protein n=1 Tax=Acidithiobacillus acidisediminis TaxID=2937799 RepID=UPI00200C81A4|nr:hypothetical protein [Acidithiobacillus sp. S30A2]
MNRTTRFRRGLSQLDLIVIGIGGAMGTGVLFGTAGMAALAGPGVVLAWVLGAVMGLNALYPHLVTPTGTPTLQADFVRYSGARSSLL